MHASGTDRHPPVFVRRVTRRGLLAMTLAAGVLGPPVAWADSAAAAIDAPLRRLYAGLEQAMREGHSTPFRQRFDALEPVVEQVFDLETVLRVSVGPRWDMLDPETKAQLLQAYQRFTVATYVANFDTNDGERFAILPGTRESGGDRIVATELIPSSGQSVRIDYVMRNEQGTWRAVDILLDGSISRVAVQRSDFRKILATGNAQALIANLRKKTADLSDGALA